MFRSPSLFCEHANSLLISGIVGAALLTAAAPVRADVVTVVPPQVLIAPPPGVLVAPSAPPGAPPELTPDNPDESVVWRSGHWVWDAGNWVWAPGSYVARPRDTAMRQPGHWLARPDGSYTWAEAEWD